MSPVEVHDAPNHVLVIGAGPAGLMAAETLARAGLRVTVFEAKPSVARKFLMAGKSGLNLTKAEPADVFLQAFHEAADWLAPALAAFGPGQMQDFARGLGQEVFTGSTLRVFPVAMKGSPFLRAWLARLAGLGVEIRTRWRWTGLDGRTAEFATPEGAQRVTGARIILALGGASWSRLGSDGVWTEILRPKGVEITPFAPANAGLEIAWSPFMTRHFGSPLKGMFLRAREMTSRGEIVLSARGLEGGGLYPLSPPLRGGAPLQIDLLPHLSQAELAAKLAARRGESLANRLRKAGLDPARIALLQELARPLPAEADRLAARIKALEITAPRLRPLDEAISTAGGIARASLTEDYELRALPGVHAVGEMLDWEAPTGGYLLTACFATGAWAAKAAAQHLSTT